MVKDYTHLTKLKNFSRGLVLLEINQISNMLDNRPEPSWRSVVTPAAQEWFSSSE